ncbi:hypothetical protein A2U01_0078046, partial [Trifolium medium]|nr:hypothetical protein [Trifolium medium]
MQGISRLARSSVAWRHQAE